MKAAIRVVGAALLLTAMAGCEGASLMGILKAQTSKAITAFSFARPAATGGIDENAKTIAVTVPYGTDVRALVATFTTTGSSVKVGSTVQVSGTTANDFRSLIIYTVTAADSSTANYTVTVKVALLSAKAITALSFSSPAATATINESAKSIAATVPYGTNVTALVATFTTTGSSVKVGSTEQVSGMTANNFTRPIIYTVAAADGSTAGYTVTVTVALSSAKAITAFSFSSPFATGTIDEGAKTIAVKVPYGTNVTALVATFTTTGSSVKVGSTVQVSGTTANDFRSPITYTVTAADGSTAIYTVTVTVALSSAKAITAFSFASPATTGVINENAKTIAVTVRYGTDVRALVATFTTTGSSVKVGSTVQVSGTTANDFTNPLIYMVTAADSSTASYTVTVTVTPQAWQTVGTAGFSASVVYYASLAIDSTGTPYVAYQDGGTSGKATVMKYTGGSWQTVGTARFSAGAAYCTSLAIDSAGTPYVAYQDGGNSGKATVMKYAGGSWQTMGTAGFSAGTVYFPSLAIDSGGTPYVAYQDYGNGYKATVMKYAGGSWQTVGAAGFSAGTAYYTSLAIDSTGTPYVAYEDGGNSGKATVMRFK